MPGPLIDVDTLAHLLASDAPPAVLDVRWSLEGPPARELYDRGHLPGACFVDLDRDLAGPPGAGGRHPLPEPEHFAAAMRRCGVSNGRLVVAYDDADGTIAARAWWMLRYCGHREVAVLDGGYAAWVAAGRDVSTDESSVEPGDFSADPGAMPLLDVEGAADVARSGVLLDARAPERYRGEVEPVDAVAGHIPGAVNAPTRENVDGSGHWRPAEELHARFSALGVRPGVAVGAYCGSGVTAAHEILALERAGVHDAALYVGSWSEWITDPEREVATGSQR